jgi:AraC-like DNA-binding protein
MTVAEGIGFSDVYYFLRVFKKYTAQSPRQYKKSLKCIEMPTLMEKPSISFGISSRNTRFNGDDEAKRMESGNASEKITQNHRI